MENRKKRDEEKLVAWRCRDYHKCGGDGCHDRCMCKNGTLSTLIKEEKGKNRKGGGKLTILVVRDIGEGVIWKEKDDYTVRYEYGRDIG